MDLQVGDVAPVFSAADDQGKPWKSASFVGKKYLVVYFFPADFTSGCRAQAQKFRDNMNAVPACQNGRHGIWPEPPDREPSSARSGHQHGRMLKLIPRRFRGRTRCEPRTARGPVLRRVAAFYWWRQDTRLPAGNVRLRSYPNLLTSGP